MDLNDSFEKIIFFLNQLGWIQKQENDYRQVEMMNYACPYVLIVTGIAFNEVAFECTTPVRLDFTRFHKETIQKSIANTVIRKINISVSSIEWIAERNGDIRWILRYTSTREIILSDVKNALSDIMSLATLAWTISKKKCKITNLIGLEGIVLPIENCYEKMSSISAAVKYLELFGYHNIDRIILGTLIYNPPYRTILRKKGIDFLVDYICKQEPELLLEINLWDSVKTLWGNSHYSIGPNEVKLINTIDKFYILGAEIGGLNEILELLEYNTIKTEWMFPIRWDRHTSSFMSPMLGKSVGSSPDGKLHIHQQKHRRDNIHIAQYWDFPDGNPVLLDCENYSLCMFDNNNITMEHLIKFRKRMERLSGWGFEKLKKEQLPALCYVENMPYMMLITECQNKD